MGRRMTEDRENPYQSPQAACEVAEESDGPPKDLRQIAIYHKGLLVCVVIQVVLTFMQILLPSLHSPPRGFVPLHVFSLVATIMWFVMLAESVWIFLACLKLDSNWEAFLLMLAPCLPVVGLIVVVAIEGRARRRLKKHGCRVSFFGADLSQFR